MKACLSSQPRAQGAHCHHVCRAAVNTPSQISMKYNKLGESDLVVSEICMGTMTFGSQNTEKEAFEQLNYAWDCGINFLDTAEMYPVRPARETQGLCSEYIGNWMHTQKRDDVIVASKVAGRSENLVWIPRNRKAGGGEDKETVVDAKNIKDACEGELRRLQTDYLDLFQIHWSDRHVANFGLFQYELEDEFESTRFEEQVQAMGDLIKAGKIRHWGLSNETPYGTIMMCNAADKLGVPRPMTIQNSYNLLGRQFDTDLAEVCSPRHYNIPLLPWSAGAGGALSGKYLNQQEPAGSRYCNRTHRFRSDRSSEATLKYIRIAQEAGVTPMQLAYLFCKSRWFIPSVIIGATTMEQMKENIAGFSKNLSKETLEQINHVHLDHTNPECAM